MADYGVEGEGLDLLRGLLPRSVCGGWGGRSKSGAGETGVAGGCGQGEVEGADYSVFGFEERGFEDGGQFADIAGPGVLEQAGERAGSEDDGALLIAGADAVEERLGERGDVFAALAQRWDGEPDGGEAEGEVGHEEALAGHLAKRGLRTGDEDGAAEGAILKSFENAEEEALSGRGEEVDAIEISEAAERGGIGVGDQPLPGVAALKGGLGEGRSAEEVAGEGLLAAAVLAFNGGDLDVWGGHFRLHEELAPSGADADGCGSGVGGVHFDEGDAGGGKVDAGDGRLGRKWSGGLQGTHVASLSWPDQAGDSMVKSAAESVVVGQQWFYRRGEKKHEPATCGGADAAGAA